MLMQPKALCEELRKFLNSGQVTIAEIERDTSLNRSWLSKFRRGEIENPTIDQLEALHQFRRRGKSRAA